MAKRLCEFSTSSNHFGFALYLYAWAIYRRGDIPDADEFAYISKRVLNKYPTAEFVSLRRTLVCTIGGRPARKVRWELEWVVLDTNKEVRDED